MGSEMCIRDSVVVFRKHEGTNLSDNLVLYSRAAIGKSLLFVRLPFVNVKGRKTLDVSLHPLGSYLLAHVSLSISFIPTRQKLTQQSEKFARICRRIQASYVTVVLLSFVYRRDFRKKLVMYRYPTIGKPDRIWGFR